MEKIIALNPDLVLVSEEDRYIQKLPLLEKFGLRVEVLARNRDFNSMCGNYRRLAAITGRSETAELKISEYKSRISRIVRPATPPKIVFLVSVKPLVTVSGDSHISAIINDAGGCNPFADADTAYPILSLESLLLSGADAVIIMTMGYDYDIKSLISGYKNVDFITKGNVFTTGDENIPYYTPRDYTISVEKISSLINMIKR
jgi:ABC-type Fe3+-hydroxamate transport system substrate-binding protein